MSTEESQFSLEEYVNLLGPGHRAKTEYEALVADLDVQRKLVNELQRGNNTALGMVVEYGNKLDAANRRVKELETENESMVNRLALLCCVNGTLRSDSEELAALKQGQGEPVAWMTEDGMRVATSETKDTAMANPSKAAFCIPLCRCAPTIPAGWQLMDMDWLKRKLDYIFMAAYPVKRRNEIEKEVDLLLAAAPEPAEPAEVELHKPGIFAVLDAEGAPVPETLATTGYSARAEFVRGQNMLWSKAQQAGFRLVELEPTRNAITEYYVDRANSGNAALAK